MPTYDIQLARARALQDISERAEKQARAKRIRSVVFSALIAISLVVLFGAAIFGWR